MSYPSPHHSPQTTTVGQVQCETSIPILYIHNQFLKSMYI
jgi:hypothetical protein